jgi:hypothetical protein
LEQWDVKAGKYVYGQFIIQIERRTKIITISLESKKQPVIPMNSRPIITLFENTIPFTIYEWARDNDGDGIREIHTGAA